MRLNTSAMLFSDVTKTRLRVGAAIALSMINTHPTPHTHTTVVRGLLTVDSPLPVQMLRRLTYRRSLPNHSFLSIIYNVMHHGRGNNTFKR